MGKMMQGVAKNPTRLGNIFLTPVNEGDNFAGCLESSP